MDESTQDVARSVWYRLLLLLESHHKCTEVKAVALVSSSVDSSVHSVPIDTTYIVL